VGGRVGGDQPASCRRAKPVQQDVQRKLELELLVALCGA
jgi:hypothetical protein